jgi:hypothetical protein
MGSDVKAPPPRSLASEINEMIAVFPRLIEAQEEFQPRLTDLSLQSLQQSLFGSDGKSGILGIARQSGPEARDALRKTNPELFNLMERQERLATEQSNPSRFFNNAAGAAARSQSRNFTPGRIGGNIVTARTVGADDVRSGVVGELARTSRSPLSDVINAEAIGRPELSPILRELQKAGLEEIALGRDISDEERHGRQQELAAIESITGTLRSPRAKARMLEGTEALKDLKQANRRLFASQVDQMISNARAQNQGFRLNTESLNQQNLSIEQQRALANQQTALANVQNQLRAALANQEANLIANTANQRTALSADIANEDFNIRRGALNNQFDLQAAQFGLQADNQMFNQNLALETLQQGIDDRDFNRGQSVIANRIGTFTDPFTLQTFAAPPSNAQANILNPIIPTANQLNSQNFAEANANARQNAINTNSLIGGGIGAAGILGGALLTGGMGGLGGFGSRATLRPSNTFAGLTHFAV